MSSGKQPGGGGAFQYSAFISYSRKDAQFALWLHRKLEALRFPVKDGRQPIRNRSHPLRPAFRDLDELAASGDLGDSIRRALEASGAIVVLCSPAAAASPWVDKEIQHFLSLGRTSRVLPVLVEGSPTHAGPGAPGTAAFPAALKELPNEPLWIDARKGTESRDRVFARIAAGLLGVSFDQIWKRQQRAARRTAVAATLAAIIVGVPLAAFAWEFSQPINMGACPIDKLTFEDSWLKGTGDAQKLVVRRVGQTSWNICNGEVVPWKEEQQTDPNCSLGPYGDTVFEGDFTPQSKMKAVNDVYITYHMESGAPCCMWNVHTKESVQEIFGDETFRWLKPGEAPSLSSMPFSEIKTEYYSTVNYLDYSEDKTMTASECRVDFVGRLRMFGNRMAGLFEPPPSDEILEDEIPEEVIQ
jgi:hypothetical protein